MFTLICHDPNNGQYFIQIAHFHKQALWPIWGMMPHGPNFRSHQMIEPIYMSYK